MVPRLRMPQHRSLRIVFVLISGEDLLLTGSHVSGGADQRVTPSASLVARSNSLFIAETSRYHVFHRCTVLPPSYLLFTISSHRRNACGGVSLLVHSRTLSGAKRHARLCYLTLHNGIEDGGHRACWKEKMRHQTPWRRRVGSWRAATWRYRRCIAATRRR